MKIVCLLHRIGGTMVTLGKSVYHFKEDQEGLHTCEVNNEKHIECLLDIPEAYRQYGEHEDIEPSDADEDESDLDELDPESMSNEELTAWGVEVGINPKSKQSIQDYVEDNKLNVEFLANDNLAAMLRKVLIADLSEDEE